MARRSNRIAEAPAEAMPSVGVAKKERAAAKRPPKKSTTSTDQSEGGKGIPKTDDITATPMRMTVTPNKKQQREQEQVTPKNSQPAMKKGLKGYFGKGKRAPVPSTKENPISAIVQRRIKRGDPQQDTDGNGDGSARAKPGGLGVGNSNKWATPNMTKGVNPHRGASNKEGQNMKARSNKDDSGGKESTHQQQRSKETAGQVDFVVDLESMSASLTKKSLRAKAARKKGS